MHQKKGLWNAARSLLSLLSSAEALPGRKTEAGCFPKLSAQINSLFATSCGKQLPIGPRELLRESGQVLPFSGPVWEMQERSLSYLWIRMMVQLWKLPQQKEQCLHSSETEWRRQPPWSALFSSFPGHQWFPSADSSPGRRRKRWAACRAGFLPLMKDSRTDSPLTQGLLLSVQVGLQYKRSKSH